MQRFHSTSFLLYVFQCLQTFLLFSDRLNWTNNNTSNLEFSLEMSAWPCMKLIVGKFYILGQWSTYLFIYSLFFYNFVKICGCNAFGIWILPFSGVGWPRSCYPPSFPVLTGLFLEILSCYPSLSSYGTFPFFSHVWNILSPNRIFSVGICVLTILDRSVSIKCALSSHKLKISLTCHGTYVRYLLEI